MANIINRQQTFATNGTVDAASLHNLIDSALINSAIIKNQDEITTIGTSDLLLIAPSSVDSALAPRKVTVQNLIEDSFTFGTYVNLSLTGSLTYATATGNRTISTSATITNGTITNLTAGTTISTSATITNLTAGTTISTAANITNGTIQNLTASTANITAGTYSGVINSTTGTIGNFTTTLTGDLTISAGVATASTATVAKLASAQEYTAAHNFNATTLTSGSSIAWNLSANQVARLVLSTNGTMADASNKVDGAVYILLVTQGTGSNTLAWDATYKWPGGTTPTLTTGSAKSDIFTFISNGTSLFGVASQNYS
jgi:hypothetical protein